MASCQKNTDYLVRNSSGQQIRNIAFSSDGKTLEIWQTGATSPECTFNINDTVATGIQLIGDNMQIVDAISGLSNTLNMRVPGATVEIAEQSGTLNIIGMGNVVIGIKANLQYDTASGDVIANY